MQDERTPTRSPSSARSPWSSTSTSASAVRPARSPARSSGTRTRAPTTRTGTTSRPTRAGDTLPTGSRRGDGRRPGRSSGGDSGARLRLRTGLDLQSRGGLRSAGQAASEKAWLRPAEKPSWGPNWDEDHGSGEYPQENHYFYLPRLCNHCTHPACLDACPRSAIDKRTQDGIVLVDQDRCHGYRFCVEACPTRRSTSTRSGGRDQVHLLSAADRRRRAPACARQCPGRLRFVGYLDDPEGPIWKLVNEWKVALPLHPEYGLEPNVFYVPPSQPAGAGRARSATGKPRIPLAYLEGSSGRRSVRRSRRWTASATSAGEGKPAS